MKKKVTFGTLLFCCFLVSLISIAIPKLINKEENKMASPVVVNNCRSGMEQIRLPNYRYTKPLVLADVGNENPSFSELRTNVEQFIKQTVFSGKASEVSVYFRRLDNGSWFAINPNLTFNPASLSKIVFLITYLKEAETNPKVLDKKVYFQKNESEAFVQNIKDFQLKKNTWYTIRDLLGYMIKYSDNDATMLIIQNLNKNLHKQIFNDFKIPEPPEFGEYVISAPDFSKFFRALYNATYIRPDLSEYGLKLLTQSTFSDGLRKGIDSTVEIAHKFGERVIENNVQLHEFGIVFNGNDPYLIGVMTKGNSLKELSTVIAEISRITFSGYIHSMGVNAI